MTGRSTGTPLWRRNSSWLIVPSSNSPYWKLGTSGLEVWRFIYSRSQTPHFFGGDQGIRNTGDQQVSEAGVPLGRLFGARASCDAKNATLNANSI